jgi:hypothetical protein
MPEQAADGVTKILQECRHTAARDKRCATDGCPFRVDFLPVAPAGVPRTRLGIRVN